MSYKVHPDDDDWYLSTKQAKTYKIKEIVVSHIKQEGRAEMATSMIQKSHFRMSMEYSKHEENDSHNKHNLHTHDTLSANGLVSETRKIKK